MANPNPAQFVEQVKQEAGKVTWPTRKEATLGTVMVLILSAIAALFFLGVDSILSVLISWILGV